MMNRVAAFEKVSLTRFLADFRASFPEVPDEEARLFYDDLKLPARATIGSAGYDFFMPCDLTLACGASLRIPTGIRVKMEEGWLLAAFPRSGLGYKYRFQLDNTVGIIDSDYYFADNEGHILLKMTNDSKEGKSVSLQKGDGFAQGIFLPFGITVDDATDGIRTGGFGSTSS